MDVRMLRLAQAIEGFINDPPHDTPPQLLEGLTELNDLVTAPKYSQETPGERSAREVAEERAMSLEEGDEQPEQQYAHANEY